MNKMDVFSNFFKRIKEIFTKPSLFFENLKYEEGLGNALLFYFMILLIVNLIGLFIGYLFLDQITNFTFKLLNFIPKEKIMIGFPKLYSEAIGSLFKGMIWVFIGSGILHIWLKIFGGEATHQKSFQLYAYSHIPALILGLIPFAGIILWIWTMILLIIGSQKTHNLEKNKAILIISIPYILINLALLIVSFIALSFIRNIAAFL